MRSFAARSSFLSASSFTLLDTTRKKVAATPTTKLARSAQLDQSETHSAVSGDIRIPMRFLILIPFIGLVIVGGLIAMILMCPFRLKVFETNGLTTYSSK